MFQNMYSKWIAHSCLYCREIFTNEYSIGNIAQLRILNWQSIVVVHVVLLGAELVVKFNCCRKERPATDWSTLSVWRSCPVLWCCPAGGRTGCPWEKTALSIILLCPTTSTGSSGYPRTELALLISRSSLFLLAVEMMLPQQTIPKKMADATTESYKVFRSFLLLCHIVLTINNKKHNLLDWGKGCFYPGPQCVNFIIQETLS